MTRRTVIVILTAFIAVAAFVTAVFLYQRHERQQAVQQAAAQFGVMVRSHSPVVGPIAAPVTIVEFFDPACEACRAFYPYVKQILAEWPREVRLVIRYVPFHREPSVIGVQILEAARAQGRFEPMMEALLQSQPVWASHSAPTADRAWQFARAAGLDMEKARAHVASGDVEKVLKQDVADLTAVGVRATPTFFVNGKPLSEPDPRVLRELVKSEVERSRKAP
ncbi:DSBA oxidoreductase [Hylemonella gracilis str. Niagara R]|uniref:DSBA oxidoreductase n=1 Tax=Hylemonella gracilis str. Niagara R TaxID=1458275 RepID=A0A016XE44_9BURK|nr:thioredoxin domain-containing protein [Hylemonella gracilis]EYC50056.1 DSBA oxidoreductase [Hylemonella gracilis str. Niagara R]